MFRCLFLLILLAAAGCGAHVEKASTPRNANTGDDMQDDVVDDPDTDHSDGDTNDGNRLPTLTSVTLTPATAYVTTAVTATPNGWSDADGDAPDYDIVWRINGTIDSSQTTAIYPAGIQAGKTLQATFTPKNGAATGAPVSSTVLIIRRSRPSISAVSLSPSPAFATSSVSATPIGWSSPDGDAPDYNVAWYRNGLVDLTQTGFTYGDVLHGEDSLQAGVTPKSPAGLGTRVLSNVITIANSSPMIALDVSAGASVLPGQGKTVTATVDDVDDDVLNVTWSIRSATAPGVDCASALVTSTTGATFSLQVPLRHLDVRCADRLIVTATVSDSLATATTSATIAVAAPPLLGVAWAEVAGNPVVPLSTCPAWDCLTHSDPSLGRDETGALVLWFSTGGDRGNHPVIGRAVQQTGGNFALVPTQPVMEFNTAGVPPSPLPWDYVRETVSALWSPAAGRWNLTYLGYKTDYYTDPAIGLVQSLDRAGTLWPRAAAPIYTPSRPNGWDAAFLTSPTGLLGSDGVWRIYFAGSSYTVPGGKVGVLTSTDGVSWTASPNNPIFQGVPGAWDESVIDAYVAFVGGRYLMWYSAFKGELTTTTKIAIGLATSEDGFTWQRWGAEPVISPGPAGTWTDFRVLDPEVMLEADGSLLMAAYAASTVAPDPAYPDFKPERLGLWKSAP